MQVPVPGLLQVGLVVFVASYVVAQILAGITTTKGVSILLPLLVVGIYGGGVVTVLGLTTWGVLAWAALGFHPFWLFVAGLAVAAIGFIALAMFSSELMESAAIGCEMTHLAFGLLATGVFMALSGIFWSPLWFVLSLLPH